MGAKDNDSVRRLRRLKWAILGLTALLLTVVECYYYYGRGVPLRENIVDWLIGATLAAVLIEITFRGADNLQKGLLQEIARREEAEEALRESEARYRTIVEDQTELICRFQPDTTLTFVNDAYCRYFGKKREELIEHSFMPLIPEKDHERVRQGFSSLGPEKPVMTHEHRVVAADGEIRCQQWVNRALFDEQNRLVECQAVGRDITKRVRAEEELIGHRDNLEELVKQRTAELEAAYEDLKALSRTKDEFFTNISHELRTPITGLKLFIGLLKTVAPEECQNMVESLRRETNRLHHIVEDMLRLSHLDRGEVTPDLGLVDLNSLARVTCTDRSPLAEERGLTLIFSEEAGLPSVQADERMLGRVLDILLSNALDYTPNGGQVMVSTQARRANGKLWIVLSIRDTGPGIPPDERPRLFERFFRGRVSLQTGTPGGGLGLATAREILNRHSGRIEVESAGVPGEGATFSVWLEPEE